MPDIHLRITGKVQGVGFRWFVRERAQALGLSGWVRNTSAGDVELAAHGSPEALAELEAAAAHGPSGSDVTAVHREPVDDSVTYPSPFTIRK